MTQPTDAATLLALAIEEPDWINAETCIENMQIAYDDALEADPFDDGNPIPIDTCVDAGDLGVLIGLAKYAVSIRARATLSGDEHAG
jgi:hypothetical protein